MNLSSSKAVLSTPLSQSECDSSSEHPQQGSKPMVVLGINPAAFEVMQTLNGETEITKGEGATATANANQENGGDENGCDNDALSYANSSSVSLPSHLNDKAEGEDNKEPEASKNEASKKEARGLTRIKRLVKRKNKDKFAEEAIQEEKEIAYLMQLRKHSAALALINRNAPLNLTQEQKEICETKAALLSLKAEIEASSEVQAAESKDAKGAQSEWVGKLEQVKETLPAPRSLIRRIAGGVSHKYNRLKYWHNSPRRKQEPKDGKGFFPRQKNVTAPAACAVAEWSSDKVDTSSSDEEAFTVRPYFIAGEETKFVLDKEISPKENTVSRLVQSEFEEARERGELKTTAEKWQALHPEYKSRRDLKAQLFETKILNFQQVKHNQTQSWLDAQDVVDQESHYSSNVNLAGLDLDASELAINMPLTECELSASASSIKFNLSEKLDSEPEAFLELEDFLKCKRINSNCEEIDVGFIKHIFLLNDPSLIQRVMALDNNKFSEFVVSCDKAIRLKEAIEGREEREAIEGREEREANEKRQAKKKEKHLLRVGKLSKAERLNEIEREIEREREIQALIQKEKNKIKEIAKRKAKNKTHYAGLNFKTEKTKELLAMKATCEVQMNHEDKGNEADDEREGR